MKNALFWMSLLLVLPSLAACKKEQFQPIEKTIDLSSPPEPEESREIVCYTPVMPYLRACAGIENRQERKNCSDEKIMEIIYSNLRYPGHDCVEGMVVVSFIISEDGSREQFKIARGIHPLFDAEAMRVVKLLPDFVPAGSLAKWLL
jgi:hypothetical protein